jgi:DNA-binding response OmpR family regulator
MKEQPGNNHIRNEILTVLSVSPSVEDHTSLQAIVGHSRWMLFNAYDVPSARTILQRRDIAVVLCEKDMPSGTWRDVVDYCRILPDSPAVIIASRLADDRLWSEALNVGAWDVLAKPFDRREVLRSVKSAWRHWYDQMRTPAPSMVMTAAG